MRTTKVIVLPYDRTWKSDFEAIRKELLDAAGDLIVGIEHVGSTAVEGMSAKPCIDLDVMIRDYSVFDALAGRLREIGYVHEGDLGIRGREAFRYSDKPHLQTHHLYVCPQDSQELYRHIAFRDFLRSHPEAVREYSRVKECAAQLFPEDIDQYMSYKAPCIEALYVQCGLKSCRGTQRTPNNLNLYKSGEAAVDMTKRLYETQPGLSECKAQVQSCVQGEKGWLIELDQTVLFPEGGGQLCDRGSINGVPVQDVYEEKGQVIHLCPAPLQEGTCVTVTLDRETRMYHSQQHTGEHILSHAFWKLFGAKNVGFHSDERQITIDLDMELDREQCARAECYANEQIWRNAQVSILYRDRDHMDDLDVRKVTQKVDGVLRVVVIEGGDVCTCCGTHVERTGEVGMIKILSVQRHRGGTRLEVVCGRAALEDYAQKADLVYRLSCALSCGTDTMEERIEAIKEEERELGIKIRELSARLMEYVAADALNTCPEKGGVRCVMVPLEGDNAEAKQLLNRLTQDGKTLAGVFFAQGDRVGYMIAKSDGIGLSCREAAARANRLFDGKGGGTELFVQGSGKRGPNWKELVHALETQMLELL